MPAQSTREAPVRSPMRWVLVIAAVVAVAALVALQAILGPRPDGNTSNGSLSSLSADLCAAAAAVETDPSRAAEIFRADIHGPLHELADRTSEVDRGVAARLLEAKYAVENATGQEPPSDSFGPALDDLSGQVAIALPAVGEEPLGCLKNFSRSGR